MIDVREVYMFGPNTFCQVEYSWWRGYYGLHFTIYSPQRVEYWNDTIGMDGICYDPELTRYTNDCKVLDTEVVDYFAPFGGGPTP